MRLLHANVNESLISEMIFYMLVLVILDSNSGISFKYKIYKKKQNLNLRIL